MSNFHFSVFPSRNSSAGARVLLRNLRIIRSSSAGDPARADILREFGRSMITPYQEIIFTRLADGTTETSYAELPELPGVTLQFNNTMLQLSKYSLYNLL
jgi:hypothetical protein